MGFPKAEVELALEGTERYDGRCLNALSRKVEVPYPGVHDGVHEPITPEVRRRVESFIGCTLEQSYSEFTVELKNAVHRMLADIADVDHSKFARHRGHRRAQYQRTRRVG